MKTTPKDFFLHLGATISLYVTAISLINLSFTIINKLLPDQLSNYFNVNSLVWPISILIVVTPLLYVFEWLIKKDIGRIPEKKDISARKWRIYLTLFLTGVTMAVDLIVLINTYLNGEISSRFIYKVFVVLFVSATIFAYYILDKIGISISRNKWRLFLSWIGLILILVGIVAGFIIVGSPTKQRATRLDEQKSNDLANIQWQIINYWQNTGKLPNNIQVLNDSISGFIIPMDPETGANYEYIQRSNNSFALCAVFNLSSSDQQNTNYSRYPIPQDGVDINWSHGIGRSCFERTIDIDKYQILPKKKI